ncbi:MAG: hypothetical protein U0996_24685 [Planctomycetaceae bacterium]
MSRRLIIGTDEAGYGPNLGPLIVTATAWECDAATEPAELWEKLSDVVSNQPVRDGKRLYIADSKAVYSSGDSLEDLEVPVLAFLRLLNLSPESLDGLGNQLAGSSFLSHYLAEPWNEQPGLALPLASSSDHITEWTDQLRQATEEQGIQLRGIRSGIIFPAEFNRRVALTDSKGSVLSSQTLTLVRSFRDSFSDGPCFVVCDKHGGRNRYDELIGDHFDDQFVFRLEESRERSRYRMGDMEFCFRTRAEELMPVALASMVAKYLRETFMMQFNRWWEQHIPGLRHTQGYPVDAKRFREDISAKVTELGLAEASYWRSR